MKLDLACGLQKREGFTGVDLYAPECLMIDLFKFPYQWSDNSIEEIHCSHFVEHLPARDVVREDCTSYHFRFIGKDFFFAFFDECHRILVPGGTMTVIVPALQSVRAFQDPTHRRFIPGEAFAYLSKKWRQASQLSHYKVDCDFHPEVRSITVGQENTSSDDLTSHWGKILDWQATLTKL